jgi:uncharacterized protein YndB with AHSA1/START domain
MIMEISSVKSITIKVTISAPVEKVWEFWTSPEHIIKWNNASDDWHTQRAENDLRAGGKFLSRMEAKDGSSGFDFEGIYGLVKTHEVIEYFLADGRKVRIDFTGRGNETLVVETFDPESTHTIEQQRYGWLAILKNFKKYTEANK